MVSLIVCKTRDDGNLRLIMDVRRTRFPNEPLFALPRLRLKTLKKHSTKVFRMALPLGMTFYWISLENRLVVNQPGLAYREPVGLLPAAS